MLGLFLGFHLYIASRNVTTNEFFKWRDVRGWHRMRREEYERAKDEGKGRANKPSDDGKAETEDAPSDPGKAHEDLRAQYFIFQLPSHRENSHIIQCQAQCQSTYTSE